MIGALSKVTKRMHNPLGVMLTCARWYVAYPVLECNACSNLASP